MVSLTNVLTSTILFASALVAAETHVFNWTTGYGERDLDGTGNMRRIITCNGEFPWPDVQVQKVILFKFI